MFHPRTVVFSSRLRSLFVALLTLFSISLVPATPARAATISSVTIVSSITYEFTGTGIHNDGSGNDYVLVVCYGTSGEVIDVDLGVLPVGTTTPIPLDCYPSTEGYIFSPLTRIEIYDTNDGHYPVDPHHPNSHLFAYTFPKIWPAGPTQTSNCFTDGRVNKCDPLQSGAIYCNVPNKGDIRIYGIYNEKGYIALDILKSEIAKVSKTPAQNTLIKKGHGFELWRLTSGEFQLIGPALNPAHKGDIYTHIWRGCGG
jgi:hypothetical protein